jgi:hypothetical protein
MSSKGDNMKKQEIMIKTKDGLVVKVDVSNIVNIPKGDKVLNVSLVK